MGKVFYWLKLKDDFFQQKEIKKLRKVAGGDTYTIIYLKLLLLSMKNNGFIEHEGVEDDFSEELSLTIDEEAENIKLTLGFLLKHGMLEKSENQNYVLPKSFEMYGSETDSAERVRQYRERKALQSNSQVTTSNMQVTKCNTEKRREDLELELEIEIDKSKVRKEKPLLSNSTLHAEIINHLNIICKANYKTTSKATNTLIDARLKEGFTVQDFKTVIEKKYMEWGNKRDMVQYLRPQTLFGTKFESYLNQVWTDGKTESVTDRAIRELQQERAEREQRILLGLPVEEETPF